VTPPDPDHVDVVARQMHARECVPVAAKLTRWSDAHIRRDRRWAEEFLAGLHEAGYTLTTLEES
jgi:hypothetical protein